MLFRFYQSSKLWLTQLKTAVKESPSLGDYPAEELAFQYELAVHQVYQETKLPSAMLPENCPWTINQVLNKGWLPD
jgi:hypothetical protein